MKILLGKRNAAQITPGWAALLGASLAVSVLISSFGLPATVLYYRLKDIEKANVALASTNRIARIMLQENKVPFETVTNKEGKVFLKLGTETAELKF